MVNLPGKDLAFDLRNRKSTTVSTATASGVLPAGGAAGTILSKNTSADYDVVWSTLATAGIATASHTHGNITSAGLVTTSVTLGSTPKFVITDSTTNALGIYTPTGTASATTYLSGTGVWSTPVNFTGSGTTITGLQSAAGVALPISTSSASSGNSGAISVITGTVTGSSTTTGAVTVKSGDGASSGANSGAITIQSGAGAGSTGNSGSVTIDAGTKSGSGTVGTVGIGTTNATTTLIGTSGATPTVARLVSVGGATGSTGTGAFSHSVNLGNWYGISSGGTQTTSVGGGYSLGTGGTSTISIGAWSNNTGTQTVGIGTSNGTSTTSLNGITNLTGSLNLVAGTTALNPIKFTANSSTPTLAAGVVDFDGNAFFATPKVNNTTAGKGLIPTQQYFIPNAATTIATGSGTSVTYSGSVMGNRSIYLAASTTYEVEAVLYVQCSYVSTATTNFSINLTYPTGSTALIHGLGSYTTSTTVSATANQFGLNSTTAVVISASPTSGNWYRVELKGIIKTSTTAGNFSPVFSGFNNSGGTTTLTVGANSFIKVNPIGGVGADINIGGWA